MKPAVIARVLSEASAFTGRAIAWFVVQSLDRHLSLRIRPALQWVVVRRQSPAGIETVVKVPRICRMPTGGGA
jgi:hypothetical protein